MTREYQGGADLWGMIAGVSWYQDTSSPVVELIPQTSVHSNSGSLRCTVIS